MDKISSPVVVLEKVRSVFEGIESISIDGSCGSNCVCLEGLSELLAISISVVATVEECYRCGFVVF